MFPLFRRPDPLFHVVLFDRNGLPVITYPLTLYPSENVPGTQMYHRRIFLLADSNDSVLYYTERKDDDDMC